MMLRTYGGIACKAENDDGDSLLWAGLLTAAGDTSQIDAIKRCQSEDGRLWRSPMRVNNDPKNSFSRDMLLGFLLYLAKTKDIDMAVKFRKYLDESGDMLCDNATDNRCELTPANWWAMDIAGVPDIPKRYKYTECLYSNYLNTAALTSPVGYQLHLVAVQCFLLKIARNKIPLACDLLAMRQPLNPFFAYLHGDLTLASKLLDSKIDDWSKNPGSKANQWAWERSDGDNAHLNSMEWDFRFMGLLLGRTS